MERVEGVVAKTDCRDCALTGTPHLTPFNSLGGPGIEQYKVGELQLTAGTNILMEGLKSPHLYTLTEGVAFRHKGLTDGRRQILNYAFPGDLIGLQGSLLGEMQHSIDALSDVALCVFDRTCLYQMFEKSPAAAYEVTWRGAKEETILDENLLSVGRRSAQERAAYLLALLYQRAKLAGLAPRHRLNFPLTQLHVADTLGLSIVHTNRTLKTLAAKKLIQWQDRGCTILDEKGLLEVSGWEGLDPDAPRAVL
jgi:CRP/FNR family transcriptional regulator, anaerobic regulatory protein